MEPAFETEIGRHIWESRYRCPSLDRTLDGSWRRVARALAAVEGADARHWEQRFHALMRGFRFLPGGRILAGAGTKHDVTLFNCFVMGRIDDSMEGIFEALKEGALTMQLGGGVGYDFSSLRPAGSPAWRVGNTASGPVSFMRIWNQMCETLLSTGIRRGAMMAVLRCDHPDIEAFVEAKHRPGELANFNLSVLVSDAFMTALAEDTDWPLVFPPMAGGTEDSGRERIHRPWLGREGSVPCLVYKRLPARELWGRIMENAYISAEPGVLFIDRINRLNNLQYCETISATNPCGEIPLPPYGACDLGSLNLTGFVTAPFDEGASLDLAGLARAAATAVRLLDNVIDVSLYPLPQQKEQAKAARRIGLGVTGLADALIMLGLHYGSEQARDLAAEAMRAIRDAAYGASIELAREKGAFPAFRREAYLQGPFIQSLPEKLQAGIATNGIRNSHLIAIAPTGTISLLAGNISSGIEPVFAFEQRRRVRGLDRPCAWHHLSDYALRRWRLRFGEAPLPECFIEAQSLSPREHLAMQAALQPFVDGAISKTINIPTDYPLAEFRDIYQQAYQLGLKGCTTFRATPDISGVLSKPELAPCCDLEQEG